MRHKNATSQPIPRTGVLTSWFSFERYSGATTNDHRLSCYECAVPPEGAACFLIDAGLHRDAPLLAEMGDALQSDRVLRNCWPPNAIDFET